MNFFHFRMSGLTENHKDFSHKLAPHLKSQMSANNPGSKEPKHRLLFIRFDNLRFEAKEKMCGRI